MIGFDTLLYILFRAIKLDKLAIKVSNQLGIPARAVLCPYAEIAMDVDKPHQLELVMEDLEKTTHYMNFSDPARTRYPAFRAVAYCRRARSETRYRQTPGPFGGFLILAAHAVFAVVAGDAILEDQRGSAAAFGPGKRHTGHHIQIYHPPQTPRRRMGKNVPHHRPALIPLRTCGTRYDAGHYRYGSRANVAGDHFAGLGAIGRPGTCSDGRALPFRRAGRLAAGDNRGSGLTLYRFAHDRVGSHTQILFSRK